MVFARRLQRREVVSGGGSNGFSPPVPAYVTSSNQISFTQTAPFDTARSMYIPAACTNPFPHLQQALAASYAGTGITRILCNGDSITYGWGTTDPIYAHSFAGRLGTLLGQRTGLPVSYGIALPPEANIDPRFSSTVTSDMAGDCWETDTVGATLTYVSVDVGDRVLVAYWKHDVAVFTVSIDGGSPQTINVEDDVNHSGWAIYTGRAITTHTVVITVVSGHVWIGGIGVECNGGIVVERHGVPGQQSDSMLANPYTGPGGPRFYLGAPFDGGPPHHLIIEMHGTNDLFFQNVNPANTRINQASYGAYIAANNLSADVLLMVPMANGNDPIGTAWSEVDTFAAIYAAAEDVACPLLDFRNAWGAFDEGDSRGLYLPDGTHPSDAGHQSMAEYIAQALSIF